MELDLSPLKKIGSKTAQDERKTDGQGNTYPEEKSATRAEFEPVSGIGRLQRESYQAKADHEKTLEMYKAYQDNIKAAEGHVTDIRKSIKRGENPFSLLLKAVEAIGLMTGDVTLYPAIKEDMATVYGYEARGQFPGIPLKEELEEARQRTARLRNALDKAEDEGERRRIKAAIEAHESLAESLESRIKLETAPG